MVYLLFLFLKNKTKTLWTFLWGNPSTPTWGKVPDTQGPPFAVFLSDKHDSEAQAQDTWLLVFRPCPAARNPWRGLLPWIQHGTGTFVFDNGRCCSRMCSQRQTLPWHGHHCWWQYRQRAEKWNKLTVRSFFGKPWALEAPGWLYGKWLIDQICFGLVKCLAPAFCCQEVRRNDDDEGVTHSWRDWSFSKELVCFYIFIIFLWFWVCVFGFLTWGLTKISYGDY